MEVTDLLLGGMKGVQHVQELHRLLGSVSAKHEKECEEGEVVGCDRLGRDDPYLLQCLCQLQRQALDQ